MFTGHVDEPQPREAPPLGLFLLPPARRSHKERSSAMFVADVFTKLPKGNVRVSVSDSSLGPAVTQVKGLRGGAEWRLRFPI